MGWREQVANLQGTATRTFREPVLYEPVGLAIVAVNGIWRDAWRGVDVEAELEIASTTPTLDVRLADLPQAPRAGEGGEGDRLTVVRTGQRYRVIEVQEDGEGMAKLFLHEQDLG